MMTLQRQQTQHGFTMVELIITIGILAILSAFAVPTMVKTMHKTQLNSEVRAVVDVLQTARSDAVIKKRKEEINWSASGLKLNYTAITPNNPYIGYDFMGRLVDASGNLVDCINIVIRHKKAPSIVASIEVRGVGSPDVLKLEQNECRKR